MARFKILKKGSVQEYRGYRINSSYDLSEFTLNALISTLTRARFHLENLTAVRLDFSIKKAPLDEYIGCSNPDVMCCFNEFMNRLYKVESIEYFMNWKLEWSESKGFHIHAVFYFNHSLIKTFSLTSNTYKLFNERWDSATEGNGNINICKSSIALKEDAYSVSGEQSYHSVIIPKDIALLSRMDLNDNALKFHLQKLQLNKKCGFFHWVSYLAKTDQLAPNHWKCFGTKTKINES